MLLLAGTSEKFISTSLKYYNLDPCHYFSAPGLLWDDMLKIVKIELEKLFTLIKTCFLNKESEEALVILIKVKVKQIMNMAKIMIKKNLKNILFISI